MTGPARSRRRVGWWTAVLAALVVTGCAAPAPAGPSPDTGPPPPGFPVTVQNCGRALTFDGPPRRVVSLWQAPTEMILALGARDRLVAIGGSYAPLPPDLEAAARGVPTIGTSMSWPSREVLLSEQPDLVVGQILDGFAFDTSRGYASVPEIEAGGAQVYSANACTLADNDTLSIDTTVRTLRELGAVLGARERAEQLVADLQRRRAAVVAAVRDRPVVRTAFYNGGEGPLQVLSGGNVADLIRTAGGENVFPPAAMSVSAEEFAAGNAAVILVGTFPGQDFAAQRDYLVRTFPELPAVRDGRIVEVPNVETEVSVRITDGLARIGAALHPESGLRPPGP